MSATDEATVAVLWAFARSPSADTLAAVPLADDDLWLGLADQLLVRRTGAELIDPEAWQLVVPHFRGRSGPHSAIDHLGAADDVVVTVGPHPRCVGNAVAAPADLEDLRRISIQPSRPLSCIGWWAVDLFLNPDGSLVAVTLDLFEP